MDNNSTTLSHGRLLRAQLELVTPTTVAGTLYGIALTLFCLYVHSVVHRLQDNERKGQAKFMLGYSTVIMLCGLYNLVENTWLAQDAYIKHSNYPGGPYSYLTTTYHAPAIALAFVCQVVVDVMTSVIQIWRVWVIWSATRYAPLVVVFPSLCVVAFTGLYIRSVVIETTLPIEEAIDLDIATGTAGSALQGATTILCTLTISLFLIFQHCRQRKLIGKAQGSAGYMKIVAMLIESYALESIWLLIEAVLFHQVVAFFSETITSIEIIAYLLVQYRVATGNAYESQRGQSHISSLHWNNSSHGMTSHEETTCEAGGEGCASAKPEASAGLLNSSTAC